MFTVKWVAADGSQALYSNVREVHYSPASETESKQAGVVFEFDGHHRLIDVGRIYVMNNEGRTVDRYFLKGDKEFPHGMEPQN